MTASQNAKTGWFVTYEGTEWRCASHPAALVKIYQLKSRVAVPWKLIIIERALTTRDLVGI
jgi:hypothetical protein